MNKNKQAWLGWIVPAILCIIWIMVSKNGEPVSRALPTPKQLAMMVYDFAVGGLGLTTYSGTLIRNLLTSTFRVIKGFLLASVLGMAAGFIMGKSEKLCKMIDPMLQAIRAIPGIGFLPISIVWFGVGEKNTLFLITLAAFFPVYLNTMEGVMKIPKDYIRSGRMLGANGAALFGTVIFPAAFPQIFVGLRLALGLSWAYLVLGEMTGVTVGIGAVMMTGRMLGNVSLVITGMIVIAIAGKLCDWILVILYRLIYEKGSVHHYGK